MGYAVAQTLFPPLTQTKCVLPSEKGKIINKSSPINIHSAGRYQSNFELQKQCSLARSLAAF